MCGCVNKTPGTELICFSRATDSKMMAIGNPLYELDRMSILKIGQGNAADMRREFENRVKAEADRP